MSDKMKTIEGSPGPSPLSEFVAEYRARPENQFDALPFDQQIVRLKHTVDYLSRRAIDAENARVIADTTAANLHSVIRDLQADKRWLEFLVNWLDYNHGKGESDRAWDEFTAHHASVASAPK